MDPGGLQTSSEVALFAALFIAHFLVMLGGRVYGERVLHFPRARKVSEEYSMSAAEVVLLAVVTEW